MSAPKLPPPDFYWTGVAGGAEVKRLLSSAHVLAAGLAIAIVACVVWEAACR